MSKPTKITNNIQQFAGPTAHGVLDPKQRPPVPLTAHSGGFTPHTPRPRFLAHGCLVRDGCASFCAPWLRLDGPWDPPAPPRPPPGTPQGPLGPIRLPPGTPWFRPCWMAPFGPFATISSKPPSGEKTIKHHGFLLFWARPD